MLLGVDLVLIHRRLNGWQWQAITGTGPWLFRCHSL